MKELLQDYERVKHGFLIKSKVKHMACVHITDEDLDIFNSVMLQLNRKE